MNVGMVAASVSRKGGGIYEVVRRSAEELHRRGHAKVRVFGIEDDCFQRTAWGGIELTTCLSKGYKPFGYAPHLLRALCAAELDILHNHGLWMYPSVASLQWSRLAKKPYIVSVHGMLDPWAIRHSHWKKRITGLLYENHHLKAAACLHALNGSEVDSIRRYGLGVPVCVIPCGVDVPSLEKAVAREEKALLFLGRLHPKKGLLNLLHAWHQVVRAGGRATGWKLILAGWDQGGHQTELLDLSTALGLTAVEFVGPKFGSDKDTLLRSADAFILPSFSEGLPVSVLEAWAYGLPVLMTPQCNLPQGVAAGAAISVEPTAQSIARGLSDLMGMSDADRSVMGMRGRQLVEKQFSWASYAEQMYAVYAWMAGYHARPGCVGLA